MHHHFRKLSVLIPAYNEQETIIELLDKVKRADIPLEKEILVIDNHSKDDTHKLVAGWIAAHPGASVRLLVEKTPGKGAAVRTGIKAAKGEVVVIQDADLEYDPADYSALLRPILEGTTMAVYGNRLGFKDNGSAHFSFYAGGRAMTMIGAVLFGQNVRDINTCYKMWVAELTRGIDFQENGFAFDFAEITPYLIQSLKKRKMEILTVPIHYTPRTIAQGKKVRWKDGAYGVWAMLKYRIKNSGFHER